MSSSTIDPPPRVGTTLPASRGKGSAGLSGTEAAPAGGATKPKVAPAPRPQPASPHGSATAGHFVAISAPPGAGGLVLDWSAAFQRDEEEAVAELSQALFDEAGKRHEDAEEATLDEQRTTADQRSAADRSRHRRALEQKLRHAALVNRPSGNRR